MTAAPPASGLRLRRLNAGTATWAVTVVLLVTYLLWRPYAPDLSAQVARADVVKVAGNVWWWTGWFGGLSMTSYSVLVPSLMALIGVRQTAMLAVLASSIAAVPLNKGTARPRLGAVALSVMSFADVIDGRVTFAVGFAFGLWALVCIRNRRAVLAAVLAVLTYGATPLAGLFLGIVLLAVAISDPRRRRAALPSIAALVLLAAASAVLLPAPGTMPAAITSMGPAVGGCLGVLLVRPPAVVRTAAWLTMAAVPLFTIMPLAVGSNIARLVWICAMPVVVAVGRLSDRRILAFIAVATMIFPAIDLGMQVRWTRTPSTSSAYYGQVATEIAHEQAGAGPAAVGQRVEVVDTVDHAASAYLARTVPLARGWDRQADRADNPIFYVGGKLTAASYRQWLDDLAVGWVAVPSAPLDYAARAEAALIGTHPAYLQRTWHSSDWTLYRVQDSAPLASGAVVTEVRPSAVLLTATQPGTFVLRVRYSPYLTLVDPATGGQVPGCVAQGDGLTRIYVPQATQLEVVSRFSIAARFRTTATCPAALPSGH